MRQVFGGAALLLTGFALGALLIWGILPVAIPVNNGFTAVPKIAPTPATPDLVSGLATCAPTQDDCPAYHQCVAREFGDTIAKGLPDCPQPPMSSASRKAPAVTVCFSPPVPANGCDPAAAVVHAIDTAQRTIWIQTYTLTSGATLAALMKAYERGIGVTMICDQQMLRDQGDLVISLVQGGIPVRIDATVKGAARSNIMIVDGATVLAGSFDFSGQAENWNANDLLIIEDPALAGRYVDNWNFHATHSDPVKLASPSPQPSPSATPTDAPQPSNRALPPTSSKPVE
jgi:phosphatidylserine/phosphatidylglycerophosphate/cardiolipin synthase-like enzyme